LRELLDRKGKAFSHDSPLQRTYRLHVRAAEP
jgi:hypothetical protein